MKDYIRKRVLDIANHIICSHHTLRQTASIFGVSPSNTHRDMVDRLPTINKRLANKVRYTLDFHKLDRAVKMNITRRNNKLAGAGDVGRR